MSDSRQLLKISAIANGKGKNYIEMLSRLRYRQKKDPVVARRGSSFSGLTWLVCFFGTADPNSFLITDVERQTDTSPPQGLKRMSGRCVLLSLSFHCLILDMPVYEQTTHGPGHKDNYP